MVAKIIAVVQERIPNGNLVWSCFPVLFLSLKASLVLKLCRAWLLYGPAAPLLPVFVVVPPWLSSVQVHESELPQKSSAVPPKIKP